MVELRKFLWKTINQQSIKNNLNTTAARARILILDYLDSAVAQDKLLMRCWNYGQKFCKKSQKLPIFQGLNIQLDWKRGSSGVIFMIILSWL